MNLKREAMRALDSQLGLINFFKSDTGISATQAFMASAMKPASERQTDISGAQIAYGVARGLNQAQTFLMTDDMLDLALNAGQTVPNSGFQFDDLPSTSGFLVLPRPLLTLDVHNLPMSVRAIAWWLTEIKWETPDVDPLLTEFFGGSGPGRPGMAVVFFCSKEDWRVDHYLQKEHDETPEWFMRMPQYMMTHWQPYAFGDPWYFSPEEQISDRSKGTMVEWSAFLKTFFLLVKQKIAALHPQSPDRAQARRIARSALMPDNGDVQIVTLRKERPVSPDEITDGTPVNWSHRWLVSGHWHKFWVGSGVSRRLEPRWIDTYEKGPENKPLVIKDKVFVWKR